MLVTTQPAVMDETPADETPGIVDETPALAPEGVPEKLARLMGGWTVPPPSVQVEPARRPETGPGPGEASTSDPAAGVSTEPSPDSYTREQAAEVLGVTTRRVAQLASGGQLTVVQVRPLLLSRSSVQERKVMRGTAAGTSAAASRVAAEVDRLVAAALEANDKEAQVEARLLVEITRQRDDLKAEVVRLRAELDAVRWSRPAHEDQSRPRWWKRGT
jgi:hypothetical protein